MATPIIIAAATTINTGQDRKSRYPKLPSTIAIEIA
jgi:hypothetical protein